MNRHLELGLSPLTSKTNFVIMESDSLLLPSAIGVVTDSIFHGNRLTLRRRVAVSRDEINRPVAIIKKSTIVVTSTLQRMPRLAPNQTPDFERLYRSRDSCDVVSMVTANRPINGRRLTKRNTTEDYINKIITM